MGRNFQKKKRNAVRRHRKPVMIITAEGKNETEKLYFQSFQEQYGKYNIRFVKTGMDTDPEGMLKSMNTYWKNQDLSEANGDKAYIVLDMDCDPKRISMVHRLQKTSKHVEFIASNPCIEFWFILHYKYTTHQFLDSKGAKRELARYISGYQESMDIAETIRPKLQEARKHIKQLKKHYESVGVTWGQVDCNPMTDVPVVLEELDIC